MTNRPELQVRAQEIVTETMDEVRRLKYRHRLAVLEEVVAGLENERVRYERMRSWSHNEYTIDEMAEEADRVFERIRKTSNRYDDGRDRGDFLSRIIECLDGELQYANDDEERLGR